VGADDDVNRIGHQHAALDHRDGSAQRLFGRLEQQRELAGELVLPTRQEVGDAEQSGRVDVVPAGVHDAVVHRGEGDLVFFGDGQPVDIGADHDATSGLGTTQDRLGTGLGGTCGEFPAQFDESVAYDLGCSMFLEREFRVGV